MGEHAKPEVTVATPEDVQAIAQLQYDAFCDDYFRRLFPGQVGLDYYTTAWTNFMPHRKSRKADDPSPPQGDPTAAQGVQSEILVIKGPDGKVQSAAIYWIMPEGVSILDVPTNSRWPEIIEGLPTDDVNEFFSSMSNQHGHVMKSEGHVCKYID